MKTIWLSPTGFVTGDTSINISYPSVSHPATVVTCKKPGDLKWVSIGLSLREQARIEEVSISYQLSDAQSFISQIRLVEMGTPNQAMVIHDDPTDLKSTQPTSYTSMVGGKVSSKGMAVSLALRCSFQNVSHRILLGAVGVRIFPCENRHLLSEFGPYSTVGDANVTYAKALAEIIAEGGGVLCIPQDAPDGFYPRNRAQQGSNERAVTVFDYRLGVERTFVPPLGAPDTQSEGQGCRLIERDLTLNLPRQGVYSTEYIQSRYWGGSSSYSDKLTRDVFKGLAQKLYIPSHRGLFVGQALFVTGNPGEEVIVKELGLDLVGPYFIAKLDHDHYKGDTVYNKNVVNGLTVQDISNCDNQSMSLIVQRTTYGAGDTFGASVRLGYQGDIFSGGGDEGAVGVASQIEHDIDCFHGQVESWNPVTRELVYKTTSGRPQKLGTSRPLINMNPQKRIDSGKVLVIGPGYPFMRPQETPQSLIIGTPNTGWNPSIVGRFIAINEPGEYYEKDEVSPGVPMQRLHRWWHITALQPWQNGYWHLYVERMGWGVNTSSGPTLFFGPNYTTDPSHIVELNYIIAPGAWISDVRRAVAGTTPGNIGVATAGDERTLVLAPSPNMSATFPFEVGDPIVNPAGPDPWLPTAFRARHFNHYPGSPKGASFLSENFGDVQVGAALQISGKEGTLDEVRDKQKDRATSFDAGIFIFAATNSAVRIRGPVQEGAIDLWQPKGNEQKIRWRRKDNNHSTLHASPIDGAFVFAGGNVNYSGNSTIKHRGISATATPSRNLRGINVPVPAGSTAANLGFTSPEVDNEFAIMIECSWMTAKVVKQKTTNGFTVEFDQGAPAGGGTLDWLLVR